MRYIWMVLIVVSVLLVVFLGFPEAKQQHEEYDVIVIGGDPEGVSAAVSAARSGSNTLLITSRKSLGGLMTNGMLNYLDIGLDEHGKPVNKGIFSEWHQLVGGNVSFDIDLATKAFHQLVENEPNLTLLIDSNVSSVHVNNNQIESIAVDTEELSTTYQAKRYIDTTTDATIAALAGASYFIGQEDIHNPSSTMGVTLIMHFDGINWDKIRQVATNGKFGEAQVSTDTAWGFWGIVDRYPKKHANTRLRGLNIARTDDGIYINALQIFGVDGLDESSKQQAIQIGKDETEHFLNWAKENFPGFENAYIKSYPNELYVRETRHIQSLYQLPISDVWENKTHWDGIALGGYPVDMQATKPSGEDKIILNPKQYEIPFRSLVPEDLTNLLVASRSAGFSSLAAGSVRIIPTGMSLGQAAGIAAQLSIEANRNFHEFSEDKANIRSLQETLIENGARIDGKESPYPYQNDPNYAAIKYLYSHGLIFATYTNDLQLEKEITGEAFSWILTEGFKRIHDMDLSEEAHNLTLEENVTNRELLPIVRSLEKDEASSLIDPSNSNPLTRREAYNLIVSLLKLQW
ncbi:FAD-dependent oxidoreductase [Ornithinibacillus xuwenensis]|uniref:FAD-dependent oxidoreductase n=1 Tax=Ornithinibacillus xuwenensis TaxID=3144668 RepID=A0ABU9XL98_9BACI